MSIETERDEYGVAMILMNRPEKRNAFDMAMYRQFGEILDQINADHTVRCVIVRGAGGHFCAGSDIGGFEEARNDRTQAREYADFTLSMTGKLRDSIHPTIACIEGVCIGGGLELASMCDIRIAGRGSRFGIPANKLGLTLDYRELADLVSLIGPTKTLEILLKGNIFDASKAFHLGLLSKVVDDKDVYSSVRVVADTIASAAPLVNRWHKKFIRHIQRERLSVIDGLDIEECYECFDTKDYRIGRQSFMEKTKPEFLGI